jgi:undecaprenyl-diphosphatase
MAGRGRTTAVTIDYHSAIEEAAFRALNADGGRLLDLFFTGLSAPAFGILAGASVLALVFLKGGRRRLSLLLAFALALLLSDTVGAHVLKPLLDRMRPCYALPGDLVRWLGQASDVGSLPSLHASNFFAMAWLAWATSRRAGAVLLGVAALVSLSRVYLGVHWPTDVLAGAAWGTACAWSAIGLAQQAVRSWTRRSKGEPLGRAPLRP